MFEGFGVAALSSGQTIDGRDHPAVAGENLKSEHMAEEVRARVETLHGLRRSFKSLTEWLEIPAGVVAQLMGH